VEVVTLEFTVLTVVLLSTSCTMATISILNSRTITIAISNCLTIFNKIMLVFISTYLTNLFLVRSQPKKQSQKTQVKPAQSFFYFLRFLESTFMDSLVNTGGKVSHF
jgi:hypothetical protein